MLYRGAEPSVDWVTSDASLQKVVAQFESIIGIDTEFQRTNTFYPIPGLYQVISGENIYLVDPLAISNWQPLREVLEDAGVVKIMHACSEDLELMNHHLGVAPQSLFDTQLANAFVSRDFSTSYANLVAQELDVVLGKHETRSNWLQRPLSDDQVQYASEDVAYLPALYGSLVQKLEGLDRKSWFEELMRDRGRFVPGDPETYYQSVKRAWQLDAGQLNVLRALCAWRERKAMSADVPRNRVVWDEHLYEFSRRDELRMADVEALLPRAVVRKFAPELLAHHRRGREDARAPTIPERPLTQSQGAVTKTLRKKARDLAVELEFADELLARRREVEACVRHYYATGELSPDYQGWRMQLVGAEFVATLRRHA